MQASFWVFIEFSTSARAAATTRPRRHRPAIATNRVCHTIPSATVLMQGAAGIFPLALFLHRVGACNSYAALAPSNPPPPMALVSAFVPEYRAEYVAENIDKVARWVDEIMLFSIQPGPDGSIVYEPGLGKKGEGVRV